MKECKKPNYAERLESIKELLAKQRDEITAEKLFGIATEDISLRSLREFGDVPTMPISEHPRLLVKRDMLPLIRKKLREKTPTNTRFKKVTVCEIDNNGALPPAFEHLTGRKGVHNFDNDVLDAIQIKALAYLIEDEPLYGYQAILSLKNFLLTLDLQHIYSDQCREFGYVLFVSSCVYDWCYDLLTEEDKAQLIAGIETRIASGECGDPAKQVNKTYKRKMEIGFPPYDQGAISGHGSERQVLRDYLSAAVAFFGDNDSWWSFIGARVYNDYVPVRNYYYRSGMTQQGTGNYILGRHISDLYSAWILQVATGSHPYVGLDRVSRSIMGYECADGLIFTDGDGTRDTREQADFRHILRVCAYVTKSPDLLRWAEDLAGDTVFGTNTNYLSTALYVALRGIELAPSEDRYANMSLIQYNGAPIGQYISRRAWRDADGCATFMRIKEITTANHEHKDAGSFEIYYKGNLTSDGGCYNNYGHVHTQFFHQMTIAHNSLIIFNPSKYDPTSEDKLLKYYSGSQRKGGETRDLASWLGNPLYRTGLVTGHAHAYYNADKARPHYAYAAGDITASYDSDTATHVERRMLTVYTEDAAAPMAFFVYDDVESREPSFEKRFLLQISSKDAPTVDGSKIVTENGGGRLVCHSLTDNVSVRALGGRVYNEDGKYDPDRSQNYMLNGENLRSFSGADDKHWGRIEIVSPEESCAKFLHAMYVTDAGADVERSVEKLCGEGYVGVLYDNKYAIIFATDRSLATSLDFEVNSDAAEISYYISGIAGGESEITLPCGSKKDIFIRHAERFIHFTARSGKISINHK